MRRSALCFVLLLGASLAGAAEDATIAASVDAERVGLDDEVQLTVTLQGRSVDLAEEITLPPLRNLRLANGPFVSTQFSVVNGAMSQGRTYTYVLRATAVGKAEIGAVRARLRDGEHSTRPIAIEVVPGTVKPQRRPSMDPFGLDPFAEDPFEELLGGRRRGVRRAQPKVQVEAVVSRRSLHVGEPLLLTLFLYTQAPPASLDFVQTPQFAGFWSEELEHGDQQPGELVTLRGEQYRRLAILRKVLFPTRPGKLQIPGMTLKITLARQSFFDGGGVVERLTSPIEIAVQALPAADGFSGAVGAFSVRSTLDRSALALGEAATLRFTIQGVGNHKWIDKGPMVAVAGCKVYPPQVKSDLKVGPSGMNGARTWEYVVVPETAGTFTIPKLGFRYFDPDKRALETIESDPLQLTVASGTGTGLAAQAAATVGAASRQLGALPLRNELEAVSRTSTRPTPRVLLLALLATLVAHVLILTSGRWRGLASRGGGAAPRARQRLALRAIRRAERTDLSKEAAAALIEKALIEAFGSLDGDEGERARAARAVLDEVRFLRYAPQFGDYSEKIRDIARRASEVVRRWT